MKYNFTSMKNRFNTNSLKWDVSEGVLPMWVADMDFETAPEIIQAIESKLEHGIFGYTVPSAEYYESIISWWKRRHDFELKEEWITFCIGVIPAISAVIRTMTKEEDTILIQAPVYNAFFKVIKDEKRNLISSNLNFDEGQYSVDFIDLEEKLSKDTTTLMILCNPHNPIGKVWDKDTLKKIGELCIKHNVLVLADEIHCDLTFEEAKHIPFASISPEFAQNSITCTAPTKTYNLAGVQSASIITPNNKIREEINERIRKDHVGVPNAFTIEATIAAYTKAEPWLEELLLYLGENKKFINEFIQTHIPKLSVVNSQATYVSWINCKTITHDTTTLCHFLKEEVGLHVLEGAIFGEKGASFIRLNYACSKERLEDGLERLKKGIELFELKTKMEETKEKINRTVTTEKQLSVDFDKNKAI